MAAIAHVNVGSNLGDRRSLIERAVAEISLLSEGGNVRVSSMVESEAWGFRSSFRFLNVGVEIYTSLSACQLLEKLLELQHGISAASHRDGSGGYADREIDIDLIYLGSLVEPEAERWNRFAVGEIDSREAVVVPHPRMHLRRFVLEPVAELSPGWRHPVLGLTASEMIACQLRNSADSILWPNRQ